MQGHNACKDAITGCVLSLTCFIGTTEKERKGNGSEKDSILGRFLISQFEPLVNSGMHIGRGQ